MGEVKGTVTVTPIFLNLGSGQRPFKPPFINVDIQERWKPDIVADCNSMPMFEDGSAQMIVLHHVIEHEGCGEADEILKECYRILKDNGSLIVCVPDMDRLARMWINGQLTDQIYLTNVYGAFMGGDADRHRWGYTRTSLRSLLYKIGFRSVFGFDHRQIPGADIANAPWILAMEASK